MPLNVLYLDDEPDICDLFKELYSSDSINVTTFTQAPMALEWAKTHSFDLIFLDYRLPGTNGDIVATNMINAAPKYLISGDIGVKTNYPFTAAFKKPWEINDIQKLLDKALERKH